MGKTHCYLLLGTEKAILIDTGLGVANIKEMIDSLTNLPITVITTHIHWDHIGGHKYFDTIAVHELEQKWLAEKFLLPLQVIKANLTREPCDFQKDFSIDDYQLYSGKPNFIFYDKYTFNLGNRQLTAIHTPGHSPGHCCFYESDRKYLYSGDLIYHGCLDAFYPTTNPNKFHQSIKKIQTLKIERVLPAHHQLSIPINLIDRIEKAFTELKIQGNLEQGKGIFDFYDFQIHI